MGVGRGEIMQFKLFLEQRFKTYYHLFAPPLHGGDTVGRECVTNMPGVCVDTFWTPDLKNIAIMTGNVVEAYEKLKGWKQNSVDWTVRIYKTSDAKFKEVPKDWQWASIGSADVNERVLESLDGKFEPVLIKGKAVLDLNKQEDLFDVHKFVLDEYVGFINRVQKLDARSNPTMLHPNFDKRRAIKVLYKGKPAYLYAWYEKNVLQVIDEDEKVIAYARNKKEFEEIDKYIKTGDDDDGWIWLAYASKDLFGD